MLYLRMSYTTQWLKKNREYVCLVRLQTFRAFRSLPSLDDGHIKDSIINCVEVKVGRTTECPGCLWSQYCRTKDCSICSMVLHYAIRTCFDYVILFWCSKRSRSEAFCGRRGRNGRSVMVFPSLRIYFGYLILGFLGRKLDHLGSMLWGFRFLLEVGNNETHRRPGSHGVSR